MIIIITPSGRFALFLSHHGKASMKTFWVTAALVLATASVSHSAYADDFVLTLKDHAFSPSNLIIPAGQKVKIIVKNSDSAVAEFESSDLNREEVVEPNKEITVFVGPLSVGTYTYFDDYDSDKAKGMITAK
jgi:plastocyanin